MFWENIWILFVKGVAGPVERQAREVPAEGNLTAGVLEVVQPHSEMEVSLAALIIIKKKVLH